MASSNQSIRQAAVRNFTGTALDYDSDWHALFTQRGIASGPFNQRMLQWLNMQMATAHTDMPNALGGFALTHGFDRWGAMNKIVSYLGVFNSDMIGLTADTTLMLINQASITADDGIYTSDTALVRADSLLPTTDADAYTADSSLKTADMI
jgi:hypothetical protein